MKPPGFSWVRWAEILRDVAEDEREFGLKILVQTDDEWLVYAVADSGDDFAHSIMVDRDAEL